MTTTVWAFQKLRALDNRTGFVACDDAIAAELIRTDKAQDPRVGCLSLKHIVAEDDDDEVGYSTKELRPNHQQPRIRRKGK